MRLSEETAFSRLLPMAVTKPRLRPFLFLLIAAALSSCSSSPTSPSSTFSVSITDIQTSSLSRIGETTQLEATARFSNGTTLPVAATWQSSNPTVATVSGSGLVTAVAAGTVTISATYQGKTGTTNFTVAPGANSMSATIDGTAFTPVDVGVLEASRSLYVWGINGVADLEISVPAAVGTYQLATTGYASLVLIHLPGEWDTDEAGGGGTVTVSTLTSTSASGTFSVTLAYGTPPDTRVANGVFNVLF